MKNMVFGALGALVIGTPVVAADLVVADTSPLLSSESIYDWSGFHFGIGGGRGLVVHDLSTPIFGGLGLDGIGGEGVFGQASAGYDFVFSNGIVLGAEVSGRYGNIETSLDVAGIPFLLPGGFNADVTAEYGFDIIGRLGYSVTPNTLAYVLGGYSWQRFELTSSAPGLATNWNSGGYVLGVGTETAIKDKWTWKNEYRYSKYNSQSFFGGGLTVDPTTHTFHTSINYRFNGGPSARTVPAMNHDWTGFKVGAAFGGGGLVHDVGILGGFIDFNGLGAQGILGDINIGYDHEFGGRFVGGIVLAARVSNIETELSTPIGSLNVEAQYGFDALARLGMKFGGRTLGYVIGGYTWQHFDISTSPASFITYDWGSSGFTIGSGMEVAFSDRITGYAEYRYSHYQEEDFFGGSLLTVTPSSHTVRVGAKYNF